MPASAWRVRTPQKISDQKKQYLDMADGWLKLARHAEQWEKKIESRE